MIELFYCVVLAVATLWALVDWRSGIYACLFLDVIRDPVRKLSASQSVVITMAAAAAWLALYGGAYGALGPRLFVVIKQSRFLRSGTQLLFLALIPGALVSLLSYSRGWLLAGIGFASYSLPVLGIAFGSQLLRRPQDVWRMMAFYSAINAVMLCGSLLEFLKIDVPALGGINMVWLRYKPGYIVELISGFYRSPDVMGLHAANVAMFSFLLASRRGSRSRWLWALITLWAGFCLLISGRRKMIGMLLVFATVHIWLRFQKAGMRHMLPLMAFGAIVIGLAAGMLVYITADTAEYVTFAGTTVTEGADRINENVLGGAIVTLQQQGILGSGLGSATQGSHYAGVTEKLNNWQEDGFSRIFAEFGLIGAFLMLLAAWNYAKAFFQAIQRVPGRSSISELQIGMAAVVAASLASFIVSHQAFSGDPVALLLVALLVGVVLAGPAQVQAAADA